MPCHDGVPAIAFRVLGARRHPDGAISGRNTLPAPSPVNVSPTSLPTPAHDSGPVWLARPSLSGTYTLHHYAGLSRRLPVAVGTPVTRHPPCRPGVRFFRTGLLGETRFRSPMAGRRLFPSGRLAGGLRPCMSGPRVL